jgi:hypothetical protein
VNRTEYLKTYYDPITEAVAAIWVEALGTGYVLDVSRGTYRTDFRNVERVTKDGPGGRLVLIQLARKRGAELRKKGFQPLDAVGYTGMVKKNDDWLATVLKGIMPPLRKQPTENPVVNYRRSVQVKPLPPDVHSVCNVRFDAPVSQSNRGSLSDTVAAALASITEDDFILDAGTQPKKCRCRCIDNFGVEPLLDIGGVYEYSKHEVPTMLWVADKLGGRGDYMKRRFEIIS